MLRYLRTIPKHFLSTTQTAPPSPPPSPPPPPPTPTKIITTPSTNIHFNLALQQYLFQTAKVEVPTLFLWRNSPTIVIGKHQNPWKECKEEEMKRDGVRLSRRKTGGGAVYQDLGNSCFSFLTPYGKDDKLQYRSVNNQIIIKALSNLGIKNAQISGRNDLVIENKKFSGSAYRLHLGTKDGLGKRSLHHGTIMFSVDFNALQRYLNPNKKKLESKGIDSVVSRVVNLEEMYPGVEHEGFCEEISKVFEQYYGQGKHKSQKTTMNPQNLDLPSKHLTQLTQTHSRLSSWQWLYGECPYFTHTIEHKFPWGLIELTFEVQNGKISKCRIYSDCLYPEFISLLNQRLIGVEYSRDGVRGMVEGFGELVGERGDRGVFEGMGRDVGEWIQGEI